MVGGAAQAYGSCPAAWFSGRGRQRLLSRLPASSVGFNAGYMWQTELSEGSAELRSIPITRICQYYAYGNLLCHRMPELLQSNLWFGLKPNLFRNARLLAAFGILTPRFRQVQSPCNRQAPIQRGHRQSRSCPTVIRCA